MTPYQQGFLTKCAEAGLERDRACVLMKHAQYTTVENILKRLAKDNAAIRQSRLQKKILGAFIGADGILLTLDRILNKH